MEKHIAVIQSFVLLKKYCICLSFLVCCALTSCIKSDTTPKRTPTGSYSDDEITGFKQMTFDAIPDSLVKLPSHALVYLVDTSYPFLTHELQSIITEINDLLDTNLTLAETTDSAASTIQVYLTDRDTYLQHEPSAASELENSDYTGYTWIDWDDFSIIYHASVFVDMGRIAADTLQQRYIIHHEMMHSLGFIGHVKLANVYTVLYYYTLLPFIPDYTDFDKRMMLLLYNPAIKPGMKEPEFDAAVKNL